MAKMETKAEEYRRLKAERAAKEELFEVAGPSGLIWTLRKLNLAHFISSGIMPLSLAAKVAELQQNGADPSAMFGSLDWRGQAQAIEFSAKVVRYCAVDPKISDNPGPGQILPEEVELDDFNFIFKWAMPGGDEAASLETFHS